jgi:thioredoxin-related protein
MLVAFYFEIKVMKSILFPLFTFIAFLSQAEGIVFQKMGFEEAKAVALKNKMGLFVDVFIDGCAPCKYLNDQVFSDAVLGKYMNEHFISIQLNPSIPENRFIKSKFNISCYPTLLCFDSNSKLIRKIEGSREAEELKIIVQNVVFPEQSPLFKLHQEYNKGKRENAFLRSYIQSLKENDSSAVSITREFIDLYGVNLENKLDLQLVCDAEFLSDNIFLISIFDKINYYYSKEPVLIKRMVKQLIERTINVAATQKDYSIIERFSISIYTVYTVVIDPKATVESVNKELRYKYESRIVKRKENWVVKPEALN